MVAAHRWGPSLRISQTKKRQEMCSWNDSLIHHQLATAAGLSVDHYGSELSSGTPHSHNPAARWSSAAPANTQDGSMNLHTVALKWPAISSVWIPLYCCYWTKQHTLLFRFPSYVMLVSTAYKDLTALPLNLSAHCPHNLSLKQKFTTGLPISYFPCFWVQFKAYSQVLSLFKFLLKENHVLKLKHTLLTHLTCVCHAPILTQRI